MKTLSRVLMLITAFSLLFFGCQKEISFERGSSTVSVGLLQADGTGGCLGSVLSGTYFKDTTLKASNYVDVNVRVDSTGTFTISSDTVNGYYFRATGSFTTTGIQSVRLMGSGKPLAAGTNIFTVTYNGTTCQFSVTVSMSAGPAAVFTVNCTGATVNGTYQAGTALTSSNTVVLNVNVTSVGTWNISTAPAVNGITFGGSGTFTTTGAQTVTLTGSGTPVAAGTNNYTVPFGTSSCQFPVTVTSGSTTATYTFNGSPGNCTGATVNGTYTAGVALTAANTVVLNVNVTVTGTWTQTTAAMNGMTFSGSGSFSTTGAQTITLTGSGTPVSAGTSNIPVTIGTSTCTFAVTVTSGSTTATYTFNGSPGNCTGATVNGTYTTGVALSAANTVVLNVNVTATGTWTQTTTAMNGMTFSGSGSFTTTGAQTITLTGGGTPQTAGATNIPVTIGTSTCTFTVTVVAPATNDYFPRTTNSNWSYQFDGDPNDSILVRVIPQTHMAIGNTYNIFIFTDNAALGYDTSGYYRRSGPDYFEWVDMGGFVGLDDEIWMEYRFLVDNQNAGYTWNSNQFTGNFTDNMGNTFPVTLRWEFSITQKDVPVIVNGVTYQNTIEVRQELRQLVSGTWQLAAYFKMFYSRDKGLVKQELYNNSNALQYTLDVRRLVIY